MYTTPIVEEFRIKKVGLKRPVIKRTLEEVINSPRYYSFIKKSNSKEGQLYACKVGSLDRKGVGLAIENQEKSNDYTALCYSHDFIMSKSQGDNVIIQDWYRDPITYLNLFNEKDHAKIIAMYKQHAHLITTYIGKFKTISKRPITIPATTNTLEEKR